MADYVVRYGSMRLLGVFSARAKDEFQRDESVIVRTKRGLEHGAVLCLATDQAVEMLPDPTRGHILRGMTAEDEGEITHLRENASREFDLCRKFVEQLKLEMQLVDIEHLFGGERIVIYYLAENRVDFRDLVKLLAAEFHTRIEMRQIGVRDEAKLLADYGDCGKPVCCNTHLSEMPPVSMKMAKLQKATLDPTKISGRCGRLKCCLRYEYDTYEELQRELPPIGSEVVTRDGRGKVINQEILASQVLLRMEDNRTILVDAAEVLSVVKAAPPQSKKRRKPDRNENSSQNKSSEPPSADDAPASP